MVSLCIFTDSGETFIMGKDRHSATNCIQQATSKRKYHYIENEETRLQYIERAIILMNGTKKE